MSGKTIEESGGSLKDNELLPVIISGIEPPVPGDTESDGGLGARHVEHNLEVLLLGFPDQALETEIQLIWNNPDAPADYLIIQEENQGNRFFSLMVDKEQILPEKAEVYCVIKRPSGNTSRTKPLNLRVKRNRPGDPDQHSDDGHRGLVFYLPPDLEAGSHVDMARAQKGVTIEVQPWENMAEWDTCRLAWGDKIVEHVVTALEVQRAFDMQITLADIIENPHYVNMPVAMQIKDVGGNYPADPNSKSNWSLKQRVEVNLGLLRPRPPFLVQAGEEVDLEKLGAADQMVRVFVDNNYFEPRDTLSLEWEGRDVQNVPFFYAEERPVDLTNSIEDFYIPNEWVRAVAMGTVIMYYRLYKHRDEQWLPSRKVRITVKGNVPEWPAPSIVEAPNGELAPTSIATMKFNVQDGWTAATKLRIVWAAHSVNFTHEFVIGPIPGNRELSFTVPNEQVRRFNTLPVEVYYERIDAKPDRQSARMQLQVGEPARTLPLPEVAHTSGNYLDPANVGTHVDVTLALTDSLENDVITLDWQGDSSSTSIPKVVSASEAGQTLRIPVERRFVSENLGGSVRVKYSLARAGVPRRFSRILVLFIRNGLDHITNFRNNNLNGWLYGPALSDPRDRAFRVYGNYTVFHNYTYPPNSKAGVIFSQVFRNLHIGQRYEFSMKIRRFDGRYAVPIYSLSTSQGALTSQTRITDFINFHTLVGVITANSTTLTLYINCHVETSQGNDTEMGEIRFRLI